MDWFQVLALAGSTLGAIWYMHRENIKMYRDHAKDIENITKESAKETKEFHGRLCAIEERYFQMMQRIWEKK